jgi:hypothetical protein
MTIKTTHTIAKFCGIHRSWHEVTITHHSNGFIKRDGECVSCVYAASIPEFAAPLSRY